ncbi:MAG: FtsX-like permease family protein [Candidatus Eisenbacteria bacterium]|uniref:FtsX-like permease family protein n=1 Tax=Eiseniibacteriota bacterium TaxID=2212470 RepID=A0A849SGL0_UNCEI|nr:FtsX-like permease family protein [Candidatus Eisenbacteria bacterium]
MSGAKSWTALQALARVEWRQFVQHPRRTLLLMSLVAVPVAAMVGAAALLRIVEPSPEELRASIMGSAAMRVDLTDIAGAADRALALLPRSARTEAIANGIERVSVPGIRLGARLLALEPSALATRGLALGLVRVERGRPPANDREVALSPVLMEGLARSIGDSVTLGDGSARTISGVLFDPEALDDPLVVRSPIAVEDRVERQWLVGLAGDSVASAARALEAAGYAVHTRTESGRRGATVTAVIFLFGSVGFFEAALVIAAAFAVSLRRRQREIGLLGSLGATVSGITRAMLLSAVALGAVAATIGVGLGAAGAAAVLPFLDTLNRRWNGSFEFPLEYALPAAWLGVAAAAIAVLFPARFSARLPIREALGARRPVRAVSRRWLVAGLAIETMAVALLLVPRGHGVMSGLAVIGSAVLGVIGFGACSPWVLAALGRRAGPLPLAWRLALRDSGRFAARNGPVVTAVLAAMAMGVMVAVLVASLDGKITSFPAPYRDDQIVVEGAGAEDVARRVAQAQRAIAVAPVTAAYAQGVPLRVRFAGDSATMRRIDWVACGDEALLRAIDGDAGANAFRDGALIAIGLPKGAGELRVIAGPRRRRIAWPTTQRIAMTQNVVGPAFVVASSALESRGLTSGPPPRNALVPWVMRLDHAVTQQEIRAAQALAAATPGTNVDAVLLHRGPARSFFFTMLAACLLTALVVVLVATSLTAAESAGDEHVLHTVGAAPSLLREHAAARAGYLALLGCVLAIPAGMMPAIGLLASTNFAVQLVIPWRDVALCTGLLPMLAYAVTWWGGGGRRVVLAEA